MAEALTVHLIDDDDGVRDALTILLAESGFSVRSYRSALIFLENISSIAPGCIVSDIRMPGMDGMELQQKLIERQIKVPMIFITGHGDVPLAVQALRAGAVDFIEKPFDENVLIESIRRALRLSEQTQARELAVNEIRERFAMLTGREREVLDCLVIGRPNKIIAFDLGMSMRTVEVHRARIMTKMKAHSLSELVRLVLSITPDPAVAAPSPIQPS